MQALSNDDADASKSCTWPVKTHHAEETHHPSMSKLFLDLSSLHFSYFGCLFPTTCSSPWIERQPPNPTNRTHPNSQPTQNQHNTPSPQPSLRANFLRSHPHTPKKIPQMFHQQFMKDFLILCGGLGKSEVSSKGPCGRPNNQPTNQSQQAKSFNPFQR